MSMGELDRLGIVTQSEKGKKRYFFEGEEVMTATLQDKKWKLGLEVILPEVSAVVNIVRQNKSVVEQGPLWHRRLGHLGSQNLKKLAKIYPSMDLRGLEAQGTCEECVLATQTRREFVRSSKPRSSFPLDLVFMDFLVMDVLGRNEEKYALVITDDASLCKFVYPCQTRNGQDLLEVFKVWLTWAERMTNRKLKVVRSDNAKEFVHGPLSRYLVEMGIEHQTIVPYEHEQAGSAEISNRILINRARSILFEACGSGGREYWPDALLYANFAANRSPTVASEDKVPIEVFTGISPSIEKLRVFGAKAWARYPPEKLRSAGKLSPRSRPCRFLGYANHGHAYLLMDENTRKIFKATNVKFDETDVKLPSIDEERVVDTGNSSPEVSWEDLLDTSPTSSPIRGREDDQVVPDEPDNPVTEQVSPVEVIGEQVVESSDEDEVEPTFLHRIVQQAEDEDNEESDPPTPTPVLRRGTRVRRKPGEYWKNSATQQPGAMFVFAAMGLDRNEVIKARKREIDTLERKKVWELTLLPPGRKAVPSFFVDGRKSSDDGKNMGEYKSRLVLDGSKTTKGIDYEETYSPTIKINSLRVLLSTINHYGMEAEQTDFKAAYVNAKMDREVYMRQPPGFAKYPEEFQGKGQVVCKLLKALYGANPSGRLWNLEVDKWFKEQGFQQSEFDPCFYMRGSRKEKTQILMVIWSDDIIAAYFKEHKKAFEEVMEKMAAKYEVSKRSVLKRYVSMDIRRNTEKRILVVSQQKAVEEMVEAQGMQIVKNRAVPIIPGYNMHAEQTEENGMPYRSIVGGINYINQFSRPDLSYAVSTLSRYNNAPSGTHGKALVNCMKYLAGSTDIVLQYKGGEREFRSHYGYCDAGFYSDKVTASSQIGYCTFLGNDLIHWKSKLPQLIATSTTMAEMLGAYYCATQMIWEDEFYKSLGLTEGVPIIYTDSEPFYRIVTSENHLDRTKHEATKIAWLRGLVRSKRIEFRKCSSEANRADIFTKALGRNKFMEGVKALGLVDEGSIDL